MTISYNWLSEYLPEKVAPERLSHILTSIGLEVESLEKYEEFKGGLKGLVVGEVKECSKHPDADKLSLTKVDIGSDELLSIVCGAPNVAAGQKVMVATIGATIYPVSDEPITMKKAKIRGAESNGMICAEDEIGLSSNHAGIMILPNNTKVGLPASDYFGNYEDYVFEIGLTPNRMDAMSHLGVAKDVCAYLSHHNNQSFATKLPYANNFNVDNTNSNIAVSIDDKEGCKRYSGVSIQNITVADSPKWLQQKLKSIGLRPINNIVDITNFILHETGQPLHSFDADKIGGNKVVVKKVPEGSTFITLDGKEKKLSSEDVIIADANHAMCLAGVYGGLNSGVTKDTKNVFLESAWFNPTNIRKTSFRHGLRTDAATRFEKGVDISNTVNVLKRAAVLIKEIAGGQIASEVIDIYPTQENKKVVTISFDYLKKLSGKNYDSTAAKNILTNLGFDILNETAIELKVAVPFSKPDISIPADIVEEIMRIDGLDNIEIPTFISIAPSVETLGHAAACKEKVANALVGAGFNEIFTNSITNAAYYSETELASTVKMINSLSADLNVMRYSMLETGLESVAYNLNRKNNNLQFFEFGKTYNSAQTGEYKEDQQLALFITGKKSNDGWKIKAEKSDIYFIKGIVDKTLSHLGIKQYTFEATANNKLDNCITVKIKDNIIAIIGEVNKVTLSKFDIKQAVYFSTIAWDKVVGFNQKQNISFEEISKFPAVLRDLALVVDKQVEFKQIQQVTQSAKINKLQSMSLFDVFENEKLGANKKSMAVSFTFLDKEKTLTDADIDAMMKKITASYEKELNAEIRK